MDYLIWGIRNVNGPPTTFHIKDRSTIIRSIPATFSDESQQFADLTRLVMNRNSSLISNWLADGGDYRCVVGQWHGSYYLQS
jgi:hypothetical protein